MKILGYKTKYGAGQNLKDVYDSLIEKNYEIAVTSDSPSLARDYSGNQSEPEFDALLDEYLDGSETRNIDISGRYAFTIWKKETFEKYIRNLEFGGSALIWFFKKPFEELNYQFHLKNWTEAVFAYDGRLFYEIFSTEEKTKIESGFDRIEYPGSINGPGGLTIKT